MATTTKPPRGPQGDGKRASRWLAIVIALFILGCIAFNLLWGHIRAAGADIAPGPGQSGPASQQRSVA
jgi:hypothetical protein